jgi:hypothetical protein
VIFQSRQGIVAVKTIASDSGQLLWRGSYPLEKGPLDSLQLSDSYLVELAMGQTNQSGLSVKVIFRDRKGGKLDLAQQFVRGKGSADGPRIRAWEVVDGGIAFETSGDVHLWKNTLPAQSAPK